MIKEIDRTGCIKCGLCAKFCPGNVILINPSDNLPYIEYADDCWNCFTCELICPVNVIYVGPYRKEKPLAW